MPPAPLTAAGLAFAEPGHAARMVLPRKLLLLVYLGVGVAVAASKDYLEDLDTLKRIVSGVLAIVLWPLLFLGIDLRVT